MEAWGVEQWEWATHKILFWEDDDVQKGRILRFFHFCSGYALIFLVAFSHLIYPAFWLQTLVLFLVALVWIQHLVFNGCISSKVEQKLIGDSTSFVDPILELFHIEPTKEIGVFTVTLISTLGANLLFLEWISRLHHKVIPFAITLSQHAQ